jgi:hypothetical protein
MLKSAQQDGTSYVYRCNSNDVARFLRSLPTHQASPIAQSRYPRDRLRVDFPRTPRPGECGGNCGEMRECDAEERRMRDRLQIPRSFLLLLSQSIPLADVELCR